MLVSVLALRACAFESRRLGGAVPNAYLERAVISGITPVRSPSFFVLGDHSLDDLLRRRIAFLRRPAEPLPEFAARIDPGGDVLAFANRAMQAEVGVLVVAEPLMSAAVPVARRDQTKEGAWRVCPGPGPKSISRPSRHTLSVGLSDFFASGGCGAPFPFPRFAPSGGGPWELSGHARFLRVHRGSSPRIPYAVDGPFSCPPTGQGLRPRFSPLFRRSPWSV